MLAGDQLLTGPAYRPCTAPLQTAHETALREQHAARQSKRLVACVGSISSPLWVLQLILSSGLAGMPGVPLLEEPLLLQRVMLALSLGDAQSIGQTCRWA